MDNRLVDPQNTRHEVIMIWQRIVGARLRSDGVATLMARPEVEELQKIPARTLRDAGQSVQASHPRSHLRFSEWLDAATQLLQEKKTRDNAKPPRRRLKEPSTPPKSQTGITRRRSPNNRFHPVDSQTTERIRRENAIASKANGCIHCGMLSHSSQDCPSR